MAAATLDEILDSLNDYSDYEEVDSLARARSFVTAARRFLALPSASAEQGSSSSYSVGEVSAQLRSAQAWIARKLASASTTSAGSSVRVLSTAEGFR